MSADRWQRLGRIFEDARHLDVAARRASVARACGDDEALRREAMALLSADDASGGFLEQPAIERLAHAVAAEGWRLSPGERVGAYTIDRMLGAGGAGEVWRARDDRLGRDVAIKVLLPHVSADPGRLRRFVDEARTAGSLNHANILIVYDVGEHHGVPYLVTECLDGQSLRARMASGVVPVDEAVRVTRDVARGLAAAHARGIVHRDLKPENVFLRTDGTVKILDFGLAKLTSAVEASDAEGARTVVGTIAGTAGYMAPEQLRGEAVDARADLFALGVMLYELLAGRHPFKGASVFETLHAVLAVEPADVAASATVPEPLARIALRLISKAPEARFQSAIDLIWALEHAGRSHSTGARDSQPPRSSRSRSAAALVLVGTALVAAAALGGWALSARGPAPASAITQFTVPLPEGVALASAPAVSPNGRFIALTGRDARGISRLFVRDLGARDALPVAGTEGAAQPFWSPDSASIGFFARQRLMKVAWPGGAPVAVAPAPQPRGGTWGSDDVITFAPDVILSGLQQVPAAGGAVGPATHLDASRGETSHWWPAVLPDATHFLYSIRSVNDDGLGVYVGDRRAPGPPAGDPIFHASSDVVLAPAGESGDVVLLYVVDGRIEARRFSPERGVVDADARALGLAAAGGTLYHPPLLSASSDVLAFVEGPIPAGVRLEAVGLDGGVVHRWDEPEAQNWPRISPDGRRLARQRVDARHNNPDIWVDDLDRGTRVRVTTGVEPDIQPVWSPDGRYLAYVTGHLPGRAGTRALNIAAADGTGVVRTLPCPAVYCEPTDWSADGRDLLVNAREANAADVWVVPADGRRAAERLLGGDAVEQDARFSPNGRWIAYVSQESGRSELSVRARSGAAGRTVLSGTGGAEPVWRRDGTALFYVNPEGRLQRVSVEWDADRAPRFGLPVELDLPPVGVGHWGTQYDVSPDGRTIYLLRPNVDPGPREIRVVMGWATLLSR